MTKRINVDLHVGGSMLFGAIVKYNGGKVIKFSEVDCDLMGYFTLVAFAKDCGCVVRKMWFGYPGHSLSLIREIFGDMEVLDMVSGCESNGKVDIYCDGEVDSLSEISISDEDELNSESESEIHGALGNREIESDSVLGSDYDMSEDELLSFDGDLGIHDRKNKKKKSIFTEYDPNCDHKFLNLHPDLCFESPNQLHKAVQQYSILNGYNIHWKRSCTDNQEAVCVKGCLWRLYASWIKKENTFVVKVYKNVHTCCRSITNRQATTQWIANKFVNGKLRVDGCTGREIQQEIMAKYSLEVPLMKCYKSKWLADKTVHGTIEEHFVHLRSYIAALQRKYSGSTFELMMEQSGSSGMYDTFKRFYICFKPLREGFIVGCRKVVGFDGTFLKHKVGGILLTAVGRDGNDGMYPIAWAVVEGENTSSWTWFFELLFNDLNVDDGAGWTFISDQQKGLLNAVSILAPNAEHRNCSRHIYQNWKVKHRGLFLKSCFYKAVKSTNEADFCQAMREMRFGRDGVPGCIDVVEDFMKQWPKYFCKAFFQTSSKCGTVSNNMCETFNSFIITARRLPMIEMLERIRKLLMVRQVQKRKLFDRNSDELCPVVRKEVEHLKECAGQFVGHPSLLDKYEVSRIHNETDRFVVDLSGGSCNCRSWDLNKIPCSHAIACIHFMKRSVEDYVDECYKKGMYEGAYSFALEPLEGQRYWPIIDTEPIKPPSYKKLPGRPRKNNRRKSTKEEEKALVKLTKKGVGMKCSRCGQWGHNKRTCKGCMASTTTVQSEANTQESESGLRYKCKNCGGTGHNRRTCKTSTATITPDSISKRHGGGT